MKKMNIPVGVSDFEEIRKNGYYYIDKSGLVRELLSRTGTCWKAFSISERTAERYLKG